jgi:hypothetical protein
MYGMLAVILPSGFGLRHYYLVEMPSMSLLDLCEVALLRAAEAATAVSFL